MSDDRKTLKINETTHGRLSDLKRDGETWDGVLMRAAEALEEHERRGGQQSAPVCATCGEIAFAWALVDGAVQCEDCADVDFPEL